MKKEIIILMLFLIIFPVLTIAIVSGTDVTVEPTNFSISANLTEEVSLSFNLTSNTDLRIEDIFVNSTYLTEFSPGGKALNPNTTEPFTVTLKIIDNISNVSQYQLINDTIKIFGDVIYSEDPFNSSTELIAEIPVTINITIGEAAKQYFYKQCFFENNQEYCTSFNITEVAPIIIINETNISYNVLIPLNTTKDFFDSYNNSLTEVLKKFEESKEDIKNASQTIIQAQDRESNIYRNAFVLESYLKNPNNPTWIQIAPFNVLRNTTGFRDEELTDALNILFQTEKISQKTEKETINLPVPSGFMTQQIDKVYIASSERLKNEATIKQSSDIVNLALIFALLVIAVVAFIELFWKKRVKL